MPKNISNPINKNEKQSNLYSGGSSNASLYFEMSFIP